MSHGWIKIHRSIADHWVWDCEFSTAQAWTDLLINACHKDNKIMIKGQVIQLRVGQQARSELTLTKSWRWSRGKVRRFLKNLENDGMIVQEAGHLTSIITICNYKQYQTGDTTDGTTNDTTGGTTDGHLTVHKQEGKNVKNDKKDIPTPKKKRQAKKHPLPEGFEIDQGMFDWFEKQGFTIDIDASTRKWVLSMQSSGRQYVDWRKAWMNGMHIAQEWKDRK